jgi:hypothetical protein
VVPPNPFGIPFVDPNTLTSPTGPVILEDGGFALRAAVVAFMIAFDTNFAPVVGQQITLTKNQAASANPRIDLLIARANAGECELVAQADRLIFTTGYLWQNGEFTPDRSWTSTMTDAQLRAEVANSHFTNVTYTCVPNGEGSRLALDRDGDGFANGDELVWFTDPANPDSHP